MARSYPYLSTDRKLKPRKLCNCCTTPATHKVEIQVNWFRGDDEVFLLCDTHYALVKPLDLDALINLADEEKRRRQQPGART